MTEYVQDHRGPEGIPADETSNPTMTCARTLVGPKPTAAVRSVSLAVREYLRRHDPHGLVLAVSGGADSLALAVAALDLTERSGIPTLTVTVDHGIRPESREESVRVAGTLKKLGAKETTVACVSLQPRGSGPEGDARESRYRELFSATQDFQRRHNLAGPVDLLLGHTLDDQAETVLLRLARGASSASLGAMRQRLPFPPEWNQHGTSAGNLFFGRPLLRTRRTETEACCRALGLEAVQDPTNAADGPWRSADGSPLRRSAIRQWVLPLLSRVVAQDVAPALARVAAQLQEDEDALSIWVDTVIREATAHLPEGVLCHVGPLASAPTAVRRRALRKMVLQRGVPGGRLSEVHLVATDALVSQWRGQGPVNLPGSVAVGRRGQNLYVFASSA